MPARPLIALAVLAAGAALASCGSAVTADVSTPSVSAGAIPAPRATAGASALRDWPVFGLDPQRRDVTEASPGITAAQLGHLRRLHVTLPGTVDSSPIYLHGATVGGAPH